jgi:hypothetical protein
VQRVQQLHGPLVQRHHRCLFIPRLVQHLQHLFHPLLLFRVELRQAPFFSRRGFSVWLANTRRTVLSPALWRTPRCQASASLSPMDRRVYPSRGAVHRRHDRGEPDSSKHGWREPGPSLAVFRLREGFAPLILASEKRENSLTQEPRM